ncbi:MAG: hypothetical protein ACR2KK_16710 [Acidimicrobiales bacterium]
MKRISNRHGIAVMVLGLALAQGSAFGAEPPRLTRPVQATKEDVDPQRTYSAPYLLVHPDNPEILVAGYLEFRSQRCGLMRSRDGGQTWTFLDADPTLPSHPTCLSNWWGNFNTNLAWGSGNTLYMAMDAWDGQDTRNKMSVALARSTDLGDSWTTTIVSDARPTNGETQENNRPVTGVVVDTRGGADTVYVAWSFSLPNSPTNSDAAIQPYVAVSRDGGKSFEKPTSVATPAFEAEAVRSQALSKAAPATAAPGSPTTTAPPPGTRAAQPNQALNFGGYVPGMALDAQGTVYLAWKSVTANITPAPPPGLFVSKSTDRGRNWTVAQARPFTDENGGDFINPYIGWSPGGGSHGTLHVVYEGTDRPLVGVYQSVFYIRSTDGGTTWTAPRELPDDDKSLLRGKYIPFLSVAPNGRVDVVWWDTRDDPGIESNDVYYTYSTDDGTTWARNIRISDQTVDRRFGVWGANFDQKSPPSVASANEFAAFAWDDTRFSRDEAGTIGLERPKAGFGAGVQDIMVAHVQFETLGGGVSSSQKAALAAAVGLVAVGLVLLGARLLLGRGTNEPD